MNIPMVDLKQQYLEMKDEIDSGILAALESTQFILGPNVKAFEEEAAKYLGVKHCLGVNSGTDALHLALIAAGVGKGDEVITTTFTFIATAEAISYVGATPVFVDIDEQNFNIDLQQVEDAITDKTKAVIPVHLFGQPVDMLALKKLCDAKGLKIVEDCAQSFGADINGQQTGSFGDVGAFSFFPSKNLGCYGDGGLISTNSDDIFKHLNILRNHGMSVRYHHTELGFNSRLDELQAVILRAKLKRIDSYNDNRRRVDQTYKKYLADSAIVTPHEDGVGKHVYHQYVCMHHQRDKIMQTLQDNNIACAIYYPIPLHRQDVYANQNTDNHLPVSEKVVDHCFALPIYPEMEEEKIKIVCDVIKSAIQ
ncbi:DegT/DnrJ/EryC1/StrS family aminotransferase [Aliikangiella marina]|uniref:DegT/DnrJ/EryC1/StrS family aminotransferase n=1 Tax=Aliikangiella marina TaxID=1712262 RepID=A0A545TDZ5_9GAMM|nr:DegT/DnrJ/EryC1/StrS family aminotransferase [Aliikangiella marina]TQV75411.1 DegT/DnrJ/EryC1/StrS family aminotransferase [Aliikangiella marina]